MTVANGGGISESGENQRKRNLAKIKESGTRINNGR